MNFQFIFIKSVNSAFLNFQSHLANKEITNSKIDHSNNNFDNYTFRTQNELNSVINGEQIKNGHETESKTQKLDEEFNFDSEIDPEIDPELVHEKDFTKMRLNKLEKKKKDTECTKPNTYLSSGIGSECICRENYFGDNPIRDRGCWICHPICNTQAICTYPGKCICEGGLVGDGISSCIPPTPILVNATIISSIFLPNSVFLNFSTPTNYTPYFAFCQFSQNSINHQYEKPIEVSAMVLGHDSLSCVIPSEMGLDINVSISFDGKTFSETKNVHDAKGLRPLPHRTQIIKKQTYKKEKKCVEFSVLIFIIILDLFSIIFWIIYCNPIILNRKKITHDETVPLLNQTKDILTKKQKTTRRRDI